MKKMLTKTTTNSFILERMSTTSIKIKSQSLLLSSLSIFEKFNLLCICPQLLKKPLSGLDKFTSSRLIFWALDFTCAPDWALKKRVHKNKVCIRSRNKWKHCFLFFITYIRLVAFISMHFHRKFLQ